ncbi:MAG: hypothetical protein JWM64_2984, partial [Frankiales bacterium]|nr:hypothetical protein [Frankiales bacterium]
GTSDDGAAHDVGDDSRARSGSGGRSGSDDGATHDGAAHDGASHDGAAHEDGDDRGGSGGHGSDD